MKQLGPVCRVESTAAIGVRKRRHDVSFVKSVNCCDELGLRAVGDVRSQISLGRETAPHALQSQLESTCWGLKREEGEGELSCHTRHMPWIQQAEQCCQGCLSRKDLAGSSIYREGWKEAEELPSR